MQCRSGHDYEPAPSAKTAQGGDYLYPLIRKAWLALARYAKTGRRLAYLLP